MTVAPFTPDGRSTSAVALADKISGFAKVRLCESPAGEPGYKDWLVHERDRHLITTALRFYAARSNKGHDAREIKRAEIISALEKAGCLTEDGWVWSHQRRVADAILSIDPNFPPIANREAVARWMMEHGYATGHGDTIEDLLGELELQAGQHALEARLGPTATARTKPRDIADDGATETK